MSDKQFLLQTYFREFSFYISQQTFPLKIHFIQLNMNVTDFQSTNFIYDDYPQRVLIIIK